MGDGLPLRLRSPNEIRVIQPPLVGFEIPILRVLEPRSSAVEKTDICSVVVKIGVDVVLLGYTSQLAVIE